MENDDGDDDDYDDEDDGDDDDDWTLVESLIRTPHCMCSWLERGVNLRIEPLTILCFLLQ